MYVLKRLCQPEICSLECLRACQKIHGKGSPLAYNEKKRQVVFNQKTCTLCLACLRACPFGAIKREGSPKTSFSRQRRMTKRSLVKRPYEISSRLKQFPESKTIFARVRYDSSFEYFGLDEHAGAARMLAKGVPGYEKYLHDIAVAGWELYDTLRDRHAYIERAQQELATARRRLPANPEKLTKVVKKAAKFFGAAKVGIAELDQRWVYSGDRAGRPYNLPEQINRAVIMAVEMDYDAIGTSPSFTASAETAKCYSVMTFLETEISGLIRKLGYVAIPCGNDVALSIPLAIDAGLGQIGRHGLLITKEFGPRIRIAKVLTDMPLIPDTPDEKFCESVIRFCEICEKCAYSCPSQSIPYGPERTWQGLTISNSPGIKKWYINPETCYGFWMENGSDCSNCIRSCPYNKRNNILHKMVVWITQNLPWLDKLIVKLDDLLGYGKEKSPRQFWTHFS